MLRANILPKRSFGGCLTCKSRKKKCDEQRPHCERCIKGGFHCLGFGSREYGYAKQYYDRANVSEGKLSDSTLLNVNDIIVLSDLGHRNDVELLKPNRPCTFPKSIVTDPYVLEEATSFIISQFVRFSQEVLFKPSSGSSPMELERGLLWRVECSEFTRWSMYLSARAFTDISNGINGRKYTDCIIRLYQQILNSSTSTESVVVMEGQLAALHDLASLGFVASGASFGYSLFQQCVPTFLRLAAMSPTLWRDDSTVSILQAIRCTYEFVKFVVHDTLIALVLGTPPLLHYDTTPPKGDANPSYLFKSLYGISPDILCLLAKINASRASRLMGELVQSLNGWHEIEGFFENRSLSIDHTGDPIKDIARLAVQETWRQTALIYFYMGMKDVNSADPRVEAAVQQVVQLTSTIEPGSALEVHMLIPCVIAGAAARQERHRARLRRTIASRSLYCKMTLVLRTSEFIDVLDHLWHGAGVEGKPTTWEDYVQSRCVVLPVM